MFNLNNKVALVTGGSRGIGRAICIDFAKMGANVIVNYCSNEKAAKEVVDIIQKSGGNAVEIKTDTSDKESVQKMFNTIVNQFGKLDILVNNAGVLSRHDFINIPEKEWDRLMNVNAKGYFLCGQQAARIMIKQKRGRIINISSISQVIPGVRRTHYCATKGAINMLTKNMALELAPYNITVNAVAPGSIKTDFTEDVLSDPDFFKSICERIPLGRVGMPEEITGAVILCASDAGSYMSGQTIFVDGGNILV